MIADKRHAGETAKTGGAVAVRRRYKQNRITKARRRCVITCIDENALADIDAMAAKWRETRGEAIARIVRTLKGSEVAA